MASASPRSGSPRSGWLFGPLPDLLLGCGLAWIGVFALQGVVGSEMLAAWVPAGILVMTCSIPHYGGTLLRVYESAEDRRKYAFFAVHATLALAVLFGAGLYNAFVGSLLLTLYLTWSPWHYSGQNYGILLMLLGRRGVAVSPRTKRWVYASFILSYALTFVAIHGVVDSADYAPVSYAGSEFRLLPLGIPAGPTALLVAGLGVGWIVALGVSIVALARAGGMRRLAPGLALFATQALWFSVPVVVRHSGVAGEASFAANALTAYGFLWIAAAHAVQYLWVTSYYARQAGGGTPLLPYLGKAALAGYAVWTLPALLFAPTLLGRVPYEAGLALLTAAVVNLHHFVLDGAIWKLRDGRIARVLLRSEDRAAVPVTGPRRPWVPALVWGAGALSVAVAMLAFYEDVFGIRRALEQRDVGRLRVAAERLAWIGRDGPQIHRDIARALANAGQYDAAEEELRRSLELYETSAAWLELASVQEADARREDALRSLGRALELAPDHVDAHYRAGRLHLEEGRPEVALAHLERAAELAPDQGLVELTLRRARRAAAN